MKISLTQPYEESCYIIRLQHFICLYLKNLRKCLYSGVPHKLVYIVWIEESYSIQLSATLPHSYEIVFSLIIAPNCRGRNRPRKKCFILEEKVRHKSNNQQRQPGSWKSASPLLPPGEGWGQVLVHHLLHQHCCSRCFWRDWADQQMLCGGDLKQMWVEKK